MKIISLLIIFSLVIASSVSAREDFGLRICLGADTTGTQSNYELGVNMDFIVFQNLSMQMGAAFLFPPNKSIDVAINSVGLEYNIPIKKNKLFFGANLNRSYVKDANGVGHKAVGYHVGYKFKWLEWLDILIFGGVMPKALLVNNPSSVSGDGYFIRTALELYY